MDKKAILEAASGCASMDRRTCPVLKELSAEPYDLGQPGSYPQGWTIYRILEHNIVEASPIGWVMEHKSGIRIYCPLDYTEGGLLHSVDGHYVYISRNGNVGGEVGVPSKSAIAFARVIDTLLEEKS